MNNLIITAASKVTTADLKTARLGPRFGRLDPASQLALLAVESLGIDFEKLPRERIGICLAARAGSLSTDVEFWKGRDAVGGPSPTLFAYTLPSAAMGEIAIRHKLIGPNLCFTGDDRHVMPEAADLIRRGEAEACVCVGVNVVSDFAAGMIQEVSADRAIAIFLAREGQGMMLPQRENDRDMELLCARFCALKSESIEPCASQPTN
jgi:3-oxoacyl-(acyl-carrier-protein) synthase